jgi:demethylmenaquinone methyltransferase/2-methoxy-6-polyprenyl-1,4-benzoquinol methylase
MKPGDPAAVEQLFDAVAPSYDRLNDVLSFGLHRQWKRQLVRALKPLAGEQWLDLCCGTGDLALELGRWVRPGGAVTGLDAAAAPLERARQRQGQQPWLPVTFQQADALNTGLPRACADGAVMAYGLRNLADPLQGLKELRRLLKPGGRAGVLDFNRLPQSGVAVAFQRFYLRRLVVPAAASVGLREEYAYLEKSLERFPAGPEQERLAREAGFVEALHRPVVAGQMGILILRT